MGLFSRKSAASVALSPEGPYRPTDTITVSVDLAEALDGVTSAQVELGYVNVFRYRWAGRADSALKSANDVAMWTGQVGTDHGSDKDGTEWVHVLAEPLVVVGGVLGGGNHQVQVRLPSWSPGSSKEVVQWQVRLNVERGKKNVTAEAPLQVLIPAPDPVPEMRLVQGFSALNDTLVFEVETEKPCYLPGEEVRGTIAVTPKVFIDRTALVAAWFRWEQTSHPVSKNPGKTIEGFTRPMVTFVKDVQLVQHQRAEFPFALTLPADVDPTTDAVHCSVDWYLQVKVEYSGMTGGIERAEREIVVHTA